MCRDRARGIDASCKFSGNCCVLLSRAVVDMCSRTSAHVVVLQVLKVVSCVAGSDAQRALQPGDLLLAVNGQPVTSFPALDTLLASLSQDNNQAAAQVLQSYRVMCTAYATAVCVYNAPCITVQ